VGLVIGDSLDDAGKTVLCLDLDEIKIKVLNDSSIPIHESGLLELVYKNITISCSNLTTNSEKFVSHGLVQFIGAGIPPDEDGSVDLYYVVTA
jgi:UDPglucose 6-dehydrogenase